MKMLVVEDSPLDLKLIVAVLQMNGHIVRESMSAEAAVDAIAAEQPDIILLDLRLPGIDGLTLARQLKSSGETRRIPIVAVTAYPDVYPREKVLAAGFDAYIVKPVNTRELARQLEDTVEKKSQ